MENPQKRHAEDVKNPVIKGIHLKTKTTRKEVAMLSQFIEEHYGSTIRKYEEELKRKMR